MHNIVSGQSVIFYTEIADNLSALSAARNKNTKLSSIRLIEEDYGDYDLNKTIIYLHAFNVIKLI